MTKEKYIELLNHAFDEGTPFINVTEFYSFALIPKGDKWLEAVYDFEEKNLDEATELNSENAFNHLCEEIEKAMSDEIEDFMLINWKEFKKGFGDDFSANVKAGIAELTSNPTTYSKNLPIVFNKDDLDKVLSKL